MGESSTAAWIEFSAIDPATLPPTSCRPLFDWIKERSALFGGALLNTILRNDTFYFNQLGTFLERADNTARILDVKYYVLLPHSELVGGEIDNVQWAAILRSVSALQLPLGLQGQLQALADRRLSDPQPADAALAAVVLRGDRARVDDLGHFYRQPQRPASLAGENRRLLAEGDMRAIFQAGLHEFLTEFIARNDRLASEISSTYHFTDEGRAPC